MTFQNKDMGGFRELNLTEVEAVSGGYLTGLAEEFLPFPIYSGGGGLSVQNFSDSGYPIGSQFDLGGGDGVGIFVGDGLLDTFHDGNYDGQWDQILVLANTPIVTLNPAEFVSIDALTFNLLYDFTNDDLSVGTGTSVLPLSFQYGQTADASAFFNGSDIATVAALGGGVQFNTDGFGASVYGTPNIGISTSSYTFSNAFGTLAALPDQITANLNSAQAVTTEAIINSMLGSTYYNNFGDAGGCSYNNEDQYICPD